MKSSTKWLVGFGSAIVALVILAVVLVLIIPGTDEVKLPPENTPEGVVMRYIQAMADGQYDTARTYLTDNVSNEYPIKPGYQYNNGPEPAWKVSVADSTVKESTATVSIEISIFRPQSGFSNPVDTYTNLYTLEKIDGIWTITNMTNRIFWYLW